ncbi:MAG: hypothetical protein Q7V20_21655 [Aquabacterium sp.]|uniref:hypothetical protein n=1 Tax=Aquabacterium sp. TaxID=1872578 RepID=UPI00271D739B|nr:hypothetical protein [Aquabacterium sp.]MDO9006058.1 hypothetical protein [Aquabacterium sp.]
MRFLIIEDESDFVDSIKVAAESHSDIEIVTPGEANLSEKFQDGESVELQLFKRVKEICSTRGIDLVLLDTDISKFQNGAGHTLYRHALRQAGVPVCRYSKKQSNTQVSQLRDLYRLARDGSSAVWVPSNLVQRNMLLSELFPWMIAVDRGFKEIREAVRLNRSDYSSTGGAIGILASILKKPSLNEDLLGYGGQNFFFFSPGDDDLEQSQYDADAQLAVTLGYWLINYVLAFPGPILDARATAAFLNLTEEAFCKISSNPELEKCRYHGPFSSLGHYYWREDVSGLLYKFGNDIANLEGIDATNLTRVDPDPTASAFVCLVTGEIISSDDAAVSPDWIPPGAQLARIRQDIYDQLGPLLRV